MLWLGIAASTVPGATDTFTARLFRAYPGLVEARAHVANPLNRDKATSRGARAYETKALPNGHQRWQIALVPPGPPPHPHQDR